MPYTKDDSKKFTLLENKSRAEVTSIIEKAYPELVKAINAVQLKGLGRNSIEEVILACMEAYFATRSITPPSVDILDLPSSLHEMSNIIIERLLSVPSVLDATLAAPVEHEAQEPTVYDVQTAAPVITDAREKATEDEYFVIVSVSGDAKLYLKKSGWTPDVGEARKFRTMETAEAFRNRAHPGKEIEKVFAPLAKHGFVLVSEKSASKPEYWNGKMFTPHRTNSKVYNTEERAEKMLHHAFGSELISGWKITVQEI